MSQIQKYNMWKDHFNDMVKGEILPNQNVVMVKGNKNSQVGMGLRLVAAAEQTEHMAIKRRKNPRKPHSSTKRLTKNNNNKNKKKATSKRKPKKKPVRRTRKR